MSTIKSPGEQFVVLVVGLFCVGALAYAALFAMASGWLMLSLGSVLLGVAVAAARRGTPRPFTWVTLVFGVALLPIGVFMLLT